MPEGGGQATYWRREYKRLCDTILTGRHETIFGELVIDPRAMGTMRVIE
jgi:hypothetical protein